MLAFCRLSAIAYFGNQIFDSIGEFYKHTTFG